MELLVCVKQVPDFDMVVPGDWTVGPDSTLSIDYVNRVANCFDEVAVECALRFAEKGGPCSVGVFTVGGKAADRMLRSLIALDITKAVRLHCEEDLSFYPGQVAGMIAGYLEEAGIPDVLLMGSQAGVGDNAQTPQLVAELLGIRCVTNVIMMEPEDGGWLRLSNLVTDGVQELRVKGPVVLTVGNIGGVKLRSFTLQARLAAINRPITVVEAGVHRLQRHKQPARLYNKTGEKRCLMLRNHTPREAAQMLLAEMEAAGEVME